MRIRVQTGDRNIHVSLPTRLLFSRFVLRTALRSIRINGQHIPGLTAEGADALAGEIRRIKKKYGAWTLVEVQSADGDQVTITL